jgi:hypothetical protein
MRRSSSLTRGSRNCSISPAKGRTGLAQILEGTSRIFCDRDKHKDEDEKERIERLKRERRKDHADQIIAAIGSFKERIDARAAAAQLGAIDVLHLRALIVVVAAAGWSGIGAEANISRTSSQAFRSWGDVSWPRLQAASCSYSSVATNLRSAICAWRHRRYRWRSTLCADTAKMQLS